MANSVAGLVYIPTVITVSEIVNAQTSTLECTLAPMLITAEGGGEASLSLPLLTIESTGKADYIASLSRSLPAITVSGRILSEGRAEISVSLPLLTISSTGKQSGISSLSQSIPSLKLTSSAINGYLARLSEELGALTISSSSYWLKGGSISESLPAIRLLSAGGLSATIVAIVMNTKNLALTEYESFSYNSLCFLDDTPIGAKADGIYELTGTSDNGVNIAWKFKTGKLDIDKERTKRVRDVWISYKPSGELILTVDDGENEYEYDVESYKQIDNAVRVKLGKGFSNRFLQLELENVSGETFNLDHIRLFAEQTGKNR
jgi:hypothetical protein